MKLISSFSNFLESTVNLNPTRVGVAKAGIDTITEFLESDEIFCDKFIGTTPQGSFRQATIIKPVKSDQDFDVDLLFDLKSVDGWSPADYLTTLSEQFKATKRYKDKVDTRGKSRCVTIDYESDFHIDIIPAIELNGNKFIMNKETNLFESTDGDGYALWFEAQNGLAGDQLIGAVRLMKYIRDKRSVFEAKSILLTTLLGMQVESTDSPPAKYPDLPTAFVTILGRLDQYSQSHTSMPTVNNPAMASENFNRHWNQQKYAKFREKIHELTIAASEAYHEADESKSLEKWQKVFGDDFRLTTAKAAGQFTTATVKDFRLGDHSHKQQLADIGIMDPGRERYPLDVEIRAGLHWGRHNEKVTNRRFKQKFASGSELPSFHWLRYEVYPRVDNSYDIYWQVVNTGAHARSISGGGRGQIFKGSEVQWERSLYTGIHWIECFVVEPQRSTCVGRSGPFYVAFNNPEFPYVSE